MRRALLALQGGSGAVRSACAMRTLVLLIATFLPSAGLIRGEIKTPENAPIEITSTGETTYENGLATARDNVAIHIGTRTFTPITRNTTPPRTTWNCEATFEFIGTRVYTSPKMVFTILRLKKLKRSIREPSRSLIS